MMTTDEAAVDPLMGDQRQGMSEDEFETFLGSEISDAIQYIDGEVAPDRQQNQEYYIGLMDDVVAPADRSQVVDRSVANRVNQMLPSLIRVMFSGRLIGEYRPNGINDVEAAKLLTDFVNDVVLRHDNNIELIGYQWGHDGLLNKVGVVKAWWCEKYETEDYTLNGLDDAKFGYLIGRIQGDPELSIAAYQSQSSLSEVPGYDGQPMLIEAETHDAVVRRTKNKSYVKIEVIPPEEFVISRDARSLEDGVIKSHRTERFIGDLLAEGYPEDVLETLPKADSFASIEEYTRSGQSDRFLSDNKDKKLRKVIIHEGIVRCDKDGTGLKDWYFVAGGKDGGFGSKAVVLKCEPYLDQVVFADFCPNPMPHTFWGRCPADEAKEPQRARTALLRQIQDNLYLTNNPQRQVYVQGIVGQKLEYVLNSAPGAIIPATSMEPIIRDLTVPFVAGHSLPMLDWWDNEAGERSGSKRGMQPLADQSLSNVAPTVAAIAQTDREAQTWMIAKLWASGGLRKLFTGILRILKRYQDFDRMVKMSGQVVKIGPEQWHEFEDWNVNISTGLGTGSKERDMAMVSLVVQKQEAILERLGPNNPLVTLGMYAQSLRQAVEIAGINPDRAFRDIPMDYAPPPQPPPPDPKMVQVQIDAAAKAEELKLKQAESAIKIETETAIKAAELRTRADLDKEKADREFALDIRKMQQEYALREKEIEAEADLKLLAIASKGGGEYTNIRRPD